MAGGSDAMRLGAVVDRDLVADRIAARAAPLPDLRRPAERTDERPPPQPGPARATGPSPGVVVDEVDYGRIDATRIPSGIGAAAFVARAVIDATRHHAALNGGSGPVHLGVAGGVVRDADALRLRALAAAIDRAEEGDGATIALRDGSEGARLTIAPPVAGTPCVAIGRAAMRPVARTGPDGEWALTMRPVGDLSLSFDAGAIDIADATAFLGAVRQTLEQRDWEAEL